MKNLKNIVAAAGLMAVLGFGSVSANAGLMISDKGNGCAPVKSGLLSQFAGILIAGAPMLDGIIIVGRDGLLISDKAAPCSSNQTTKDDGIIIVGRDGIMISD